MIFRAKVDVERILEENVVSSDPSAFFAKSLRGRILEMSRWFGSLGGE